MLLDLEDTWMVGTCALHFVGGGLFCFVYVHASQTMQALGKFLPAELYGSKINKLHAVCVVIGEQ